MSASPLGRLLARLGPEIDDPDEETFLLFAYERPLGQNLGFIDAHAAVLDLTVAGRDLTIHQSPAVLASNRSGGTTGAVLWKISPAVAEWLALPDNLFFCRDSQDGTAAAVLGPGSAVLELGCGIAGVIGLTLTAKGTRSAAADAGAGSSAKKKSSRASARRPGNSSPTPASTGAATGTVGRYVLTDQPYVAKLLLRNLAENGAVDEEASAAAGHGKRRTTTSAAVASPSKPLFFRPLDWETDQVTPALLRTDSELGASTGAASPARMPVPTSFDAVLACDCIYNEALVPPLVQTFADACRLRQGEQLTGRDSRAMGSRSTGTVDTGHPSTSPPPTLCIVAQQLRDPDVLTAWLAEFHSVFRVWRIPDEFLTPGLRPTAGFALHVGILRDGWTDS